MNTLEHVKLEPKVFSLKGWILLVEPKRLFDFFQNELQTAGFTILDVSECHFPQNGYTATWILAESHLAIHTFTESGWTYLELTSCNGHKAEEFKKSIMSSSFQIKLDSERLQKSSI